MADRTVPLTAEVHTILEEISGRDVSDEPTDLTFVEQGFDSLILTQVALAFTKSFGVGIKLRQLTEEYPSCDMLVSFLDDQVDAGKFLPEASAEEAAPTPVETSAPVGVAPTAAPVAAQLAPVPAAAPIAYAQAPAAPLSGDPVEALIQTQLAVMAQQLEVLGGARPVAQVQAPVASAPAPQAQAVAAPQAAPKTEEKKAAKSASGSSEKTPKKPHRHGPQLVIRKGAAPEMTAAQDAHLTETLEKYIDKTKESKAFTARNRQRVADPRTVSGFHARLKESVYPVVAKRSEGCRLWDVDGNEYIDMLSGYGSNFFGFGAPFIKEAMKEQMDIGMEIGPQTDLVEEVTNLFLEFIPHFDRAAFCNTGSEAVLATFRLARTVVGRDVIVMFEGGYHGMFDEVVVRPTPKRSMPGAPGIPRSSVDNILVLPWNDPASLEIIRERKDEIAGVIVEPVQSRAPHVQPAEFLKDLRSLTTEIGSALIFDEVVCGFRVAQGGGQEYFGIEADMASYGKVVGGGISIGIVGGKKKFMDALDGGPWQYGDESTPEVGVTFFAGTFVRHPVSMAAAKAALLFMKKEGPELQKRVNQRATDFVAELNAFFESEGAPMKLMNFGSVLKIVVTEEIPFSEILFHHLRLQGVHVWEGRPCFLTMMHGDKEIEFIVSAFKEMVRRMQDGGFFPKSAADMPKQMKSESPPVPGARLGRDPDGTPAWFVNDPARPGKFLRLDAH